MSLQRMNWGADPDEYEEEAQEWAEEACAYCGNDDKWDEEVAQDDVDLEEQFRSLETAEAFATTEMENVSSDLKNAARSFMDARNLVAQVKSARGFFASGWEWVLSTVLQSMTPGAQLEQRLLAKEKALLRQNLVVVGTVKAKANVIPDDPSLAKSRQTSQWYDENRSFTRTKGSCKGNEPCTSYSRTFTIHNYGYGIAYTFTHNNITLEHTAMNDKNTTVHQRTARSVLRTACCTRPCARWCSCIHRSVPKRDVVMREGVRNAVAIIVYRKCS